MIYECLRTAKWIALGLILVGFLVSMNGCGSNTKQDPEKAKQEKRRKWLESWLPDCRASGETREAKAFNERADRATDDLAKNREWKAPMLLGCEFTIYPSPTPEGSIGNFIVIWLDGEAGPDRLEFKYGRDKVVLDLAKYGVNHESFFGPDLRRSSTGHIELDNDDASLGIPDQMNPDELRVQLVDLKGNRSEVVGVITYHGNPADPAFAWTTWQRAHGGPTSRPETPATKSAGYN